jgi:AraC-like DNA-binding protein
MNVEDIARAVGLHPKYAMTRFHRCTGATIRDFLLQHRIAFAQRELVTTEQKVVEIAFASGFHSVSAFYRSFTQIAAETPTSFRRRMRGVSAR